MKVAGGGELLSRDGPATHGGSDQTSISSPRTGLKVRGGVPSLP